MFSPKPRKTTKDNAIIQDNTLIHWCNQPFKSYILDSLYFHKLKLHGVFVLSGKDVHDNWVPYYVEVMPFTNFELFESAKILGATHIHIANHLIEEEASEDKKLILKHSIVELYQPKLNTTNQNEQPSEETMSDDLNETKTKLELLFKYQAHYLELIKTYKEEIKFANTLQEDLRRERSQFFTQTLKEVISTMQTAELDKSVSAKWVEELVASYSRSLDLSCDLAKTHVIEILSLLTNEAKTEASKAGLDTIAKNVATE
jgi:hypothetical protein